MGSISPSGTTGSGAEAGGSPHAFALGGIVAISFSAIFVHLAGVSPVTATFFRALYGLPILALVWAWYRGRDRRALRERLLGLAAGGLLALDLSVWHQSIEWIGAGLSTVLANTQVVFVAVGTWLLYGQRLCRRQVLLIPVVLTGIGLVSGLGQEGAYGTRPIAGALLGVAAGVTYAVFLFVFRASNRSGAPASGPLLDATVGAALAGFALGTAHGSLDLAVHFPAHAWLIVLGVVCQAGGWLLITLALPRLPEVEVSILLLLQPVGTVIWAAMLFGERLAPTQMVGAVLVLACVFGMSFPERRRVVVIRDVRGDENASANDPGPQPDPGLPAKPAPALAPARCAELDSGELRLEG